MSANRRLLARVEKTKQQEAEQEAANMRFPGDAACPAKGKDAEADQEIGQEPDAGKDHDRAVRQGLANSQPAVEMGKLAADAAAWGKDEACCSAHQTGNHAGGTDDEDRFAPVERHVQGDCGN